MTEDRNNRTCQEFQEHLADLIASGEDVSKNPHLQTCATAVLSSPISKRLPRLPANYSPLNSLRKTSGTESSWQLKGKRVPSSPNNVGAGLLHENRDKIFHGRRSHFL